MKFLCDRCKTRYSIGDERVRGKILKIRCKNCNNVITVREGMPEIGADAPRTKQPTQALDHAPSPPAGAGALGAAFASAMTTKPPPALEEEWYVSIEGEQAGPYNLTEAQRWVASKPFDAELHCWSEGFDDWLPVDKVSHFRGLRRRPAPATSPPPIPRAATGAHRAITRSAASAPMEEEPKPLFAATMASLETATQPPLGSGNFQIPSIPSPSPALPSSRGTPLGGQPSLPSVTARGANGAAHAKTPLPSVTGRVAAAAAVKPIVDPAESATQIETPPFEDEKLTAPEPTRRDPLAAKADPFAPTTPQRSRPDPFASTSAKEVFAKSDPFGKPAPAPMDFTQPIQQEDINDDLDIGEVSRVVNLADLAKTAPPRSSRSGLSRPEIRVSGPTMNKTGSLGALPRPSAGSIPPPIIGPDGQQIDPATGEPIPLAPQVVVSHRRGMIALIVGAIILLGAAGAVVFMVLGGDTQGTGGLGGDFRVDTTRPDDPRRRPGDPMVSSKEPDKEPSNPFVPKKPRPRQPEVVTPPSIPDAKALRPDEIEEMAGKNSGTTQTCYRRSQRGAEAIILGDLKKLGVTLTVDPAGTVTNVTLSDHSTTSLGRCLIASIKGWRFRASSNGITARITLVFQGV